MSNFRVGMYVVKPGLGLCRIKAIKKEEVSGQTLEFYVLTSGEVDIMVPVSVAHSGGLREPLTEEKVTEIFETLNEPFVFLEEDQLEDIDLYEFDIEASKKVIKERSIDGVVELVRRGFNRLKLLGQLPKNENDILVESRKVLADEVAHCQHTTRQRIMTQITRTLTEARKRRKEKFESPLSH